MLEGQGLRARAYHLVGVVAFQVAPSAYGIRRFSAPRTSQRSLSGVDAINGNRRADLYTPDVAEFNPDNAWNQNFDDGNQNANDKNNRNRCRAVRK